MMAGLVRIRPMSRFCGRPGGVPLSLRLRVLRALKSGSNVGLQESSESGVAPRRRRRFGSAICSPDFRLTLGRPGSHTAKCRSSSLGATASGCEDAADNQAKRPVFLPGGCKVRATMLAILAITPPPSAAARELVNGRSGAVTPDYVWAAEDRQGAADGLPSAGDGCATAMMPQGPERAPDVARRRLERDGSRRGAG
jgi:hypothetical protein